MKYLFMVQGEGRGHLTQAIALAQLLKKNGHEVAAAMVGKNPNRVLPPFFEERIGCPVTTFDSPSFDYGKGGKRGKIARTIFTNTTPRMLSRWRKSIGTIVRTIDRVQPDVVVNFYEMLLGVTGLVHKLKVPVVSIGHQFLMDHPDYAYRSGSDHGQFVLRLNNMLCSLGTTKTLALSFYPMKDFYRDRIAAPVAARALFAETPQRRLHSRLCAQSGLRRRGARVARTQSRRKAEYLLG